jgi:hypothetical protein
MITLPRLPHAAPHPRSHLLQQSLAALCLLILGSLRAEPGPGDIFRAYHYTSEMIVEFDPGSKQTNPKALLRRSISGRERTLDVWDLEDAVRAEISLEFWGGHLGTSGQVLKVNGGNWIDIPQITTTPGDARSYHRMLLGKVTMPLELSALKKGANVFEFRSGPQVTHSFDWGIYKIYAFTVRIYYNQSKPHPTGHIASPGEGHTIQDLPVIEVVATGSSPAPDKTEFTPGPVRRVDVIGLYEDFNWEGDGHYRQWHYQTDLGELRRHIGTAHEAPYRVTWNNRWVPDQDRPVQIVAWITNVHGVTYVTPPREVVLARPGRSVRMYKSTDVPEGFGVRKGARMSCKIMVSDDPAAATAARMVISTWAGNHADELALNDRLVVARTGKDDYYSFDEIDFSTGLVQRGENKFSIHSTTLLHMAEVNWPGPVLLLEFPK